MPIATSDIDGPKVIPLEDEERDSGVMSDIHLFRALEAFHRDGVVVIENAIDVSHVDHLNERMTADAARLMSGHKGLRFASVFAILFEFRVLWVKRGDNEDEIPLELRLNPHVL